MRGQLVEGQAGLKRHAVLSGVLYAWSATQERLSEGVFADPSLRIVLPGSQAPWALPETSEQPAVWQCSHAEGAGCIQRAARRIDEQAQSRPSLALEL